jgi:hypothetical protein
VDAATDFAALDLVALRFGPTPGTHVARAGETPGSATPRADGLSLYPRCSHPGTYAGVRVRLRVEPGETIAHLLACDRFILTERLPAMRPDAVLPAFGEIEEAESFNARTAAHAGSGITPDALIAEFVEVREEIVRRLRAVPGADFGAGFTIGDERMSYRSYLAEQVEHNQVHRAQVDAFVGIDGPEPPA